MQKKCAKLLLGLAGQHDKTVRLQIAMVRTATHGGQHGLQFGFARRGFTESGLRLPGLEKISDNAPSSVGSGRKFSGVVSHLEHPKKEMPTIGKPVSLHSVRQIAMGAYA
ncbi:hypothetical protein GCM10022278_10850 [Allohahella marinimesophila]|uniref:Uncharacterized protein n=1 Tax=Allohahella marinimesophila TaxID=1054972 RepID=A0ABP7NWA6_9GAMM